MDEFVNKARKDPRLGAEGRPDYMLNEKGRFFSKEMEASSVRSKMKPVNLLLEMDDVTGVNCSKVSKIMPSARRYALNRAPTVQELGQIVVDSGMRLQAIELTMASQMFETQKAQLEASIRQAYEAKLEEWRETHDFTVRPV